MRDNRYLIGILTGIALTLALAVILSLNQPRMAFAQGAGGGPGSTNTVTAVTAQLQANQDILFIIDSQEESIMCYGLWGAGVRGGQEALNKLEFLAARSYKWDKKLEYFGGYGKGKTVKDVQKGALKQMEEGEGAEEPKRK